MSKHENGKKHVLARILGAAAVGAAAVAAVRTARAIVSAKADAAARTYGEPAPACTPESEDPCAPCGECANEAPCTEEAVPAAPSAEEAPTEEAVEGDDEEA